MNEKSGIVKHVEFGVAKRPLNYRPRIVLELIHSCLKEKRILDDFVLQEWWLEKIVKPRHRIVDGKSLGKGSDGYFHYEKIQEYDLRVRQIKEHGGLLPGYYWNEAKTCLKYHIGNLVLNGYLIVLPVIKLTPIEEK